MKHLGIISGAMYGFVAIFFAILGLASITAEVLLPFFFPVAYIFRITQLYFPGLFFISAILNIALFGLIGYGIQKKFSGKRAVQTFSIIAILFIIALVIEALTRGLTA